MLLGLIAILMFMLHETHAAEKINTLMAKAFPIKGPHNTKIICSEEEMNLLFEKVHLGISANMGIYFLTCMYLIFLHWIIYKHWIRIDYEEFDMRAYSKLKQAHDSLPAVVRFLHLPNQLKLSRLHGIDRMHALRRACIEHYQLPSDFQFSKYLKFAMRDVVIHMLEVHPICWGVLGAALLFTFGRNAIGVRVNDSLVTLMIYGALSLVVSFCSLGIYIYMAVVYRKVLRVESVRKHIHSAAAAYDRSFEPSDTAVRMSSQDVVTDDESYDISSPLLSSAHRNSSSSSFGHHHYSSGSGRDSFGSAFSNVADSDVTVFDTTPWHGRTLPFQIFSAVDSSHDSHGADEGSHGGHGHGGSLKLMSVDEYRKYSSRVRHILNRVSTPTDEDNKHKNALLLRSRRLVIAALQLVTFVQTWLLGLSIYYVYSIYADIPKAPIPYPILNVFPFVGPIITYAFMGTTLSKIVKATYTGGLVRPDLLLEALFLPQSHDHPDVKKRRKNRKPKHDDDHHQDTTDTQSGYGVTRDDYGVPKYPSSASGKDRSGDFSSPSSRLPLPKTNCPDRLDSDLGHTDGESDLEFSSDNECSHDAVMLPPTVNPQNTQIQ